MKNKEPAVKKRSGRMEKVLIIVESPAKVSTINKYLPKDKEYIVLASYGHIADLSKTKNYCGIGIKVDKNFELQYFIYPDKKEVLARIIAAASIADKVIMATDHDREGEAIAEIISEKLVSCGKPISRVMFREITKKGITEGLANETVIDHNIATAAKARRALDRIVGYMASPFVIKKLGANSSAGRVQSVALKLMTEREQEIQNFVKEEYWTIRIKFYEGFSAVYSTKTKIRTEKEAVVLANELVRSSFSVKQIKESKNEKFPPKPLNTANLQIFAAVKKIQPTNTMAFAQSLYEEGAVTYIRTDSVRISDDALPDIRAYIKKNYPKTLPPTANIYKNADQAQDAHECIRPTNIERTTNSDIGKDAVYNIIRNVTIASQMKPAIYAATSVVIESDKGRRFTASGRVLKFKGWLELSADYADDDEDSDRKLPVLEEGQVLKVEKEGVILEQKFTQPPPRYKNQSLIKLLEKKGIGRPSTYAAILEKLSGSRNFIEQQGDGALKPTSSGMRVVEFLDGKFSFMNYDFTAKMDEKLDLIAAGKYSYVDAMRDFYEPFHTELQNAYKGFCLEDAQNVYATEDILCPNCMSRMVVRTGYKGEYLGCVMFPVCCTTRSIIKKDKCPECNSDMYLKKVETMGNDRHWVCKNEPQCPCVIKFEN